MSDRGESERSVAAGEAHPHQGRKGADEALIAALCGGATVAEASAATRISATTIHRRLKDAEFKARLAQARADAVRRATDRISSNMTAAADVLVCLLQDPDSRVKLQAAKTLLEQGIAAQWDHVAEEVEQLKATIAAILEDREGKTP